MKFKIKFDLQKIISLILIAVITIEANYWNILLNSGINRYLIFIVWGALLIIHLATMNFRIKLQSVHCLWAAFLCVSLVNNAQLKSGKSYGFLIIALCVLTFFFCTIRSDLLEKIPYLILLIGLPNLIATMLFFFNNNLYLSFISATYKQYQSGTELGQYGYRAALAGHYSHNGTYLVIVMLILFSMLSCLKLNKTKRIILTAVSVVSIFALFLTTKRAHLLFGIAAMLITYYIANRNSAGKKVLRILLISIILAFIAGFLIDIFPEISKTLDRISKSGVDGASRYRFVMWSHAWNHFGDNPIFGHGWAGFSQDQDISWVPGASSGAHNVYLQLLYDTGILGFIIVVMTLLVTLIVSCKSLVIIKKYDLPYLFPITVSLSIQIFFLLYGLTGNFLFDEMFIFYALGVILSIGVNAVTPKVSAEFLKIRRYRIMSLR